MDVRMAILLLIFSLFPIGCAGSRPARFLAPNFGIVAPRRIAVLPFDNQSVDMLAPDMVQQLMTADVGSRGYDPLPAPEVKEKLRSIGITDGGQLPALTPGKVAEALGVDALFYGVIEDFVFQNVGFVLRRHVKVRSKLVLASSGETLWEDENQATGMDFALNRKDAERLFLLGLAQRTIQNIANRPLWPQARLAVWRLLGRLPPPGLGQQLPSAPPSPPPGPPPSLPPAPPVSGK